MITSNGQLEKREKKFQIFFSAHVIMRREFFFINSNNFQVLKKSERK